MAKVKVSEWVSQWVTWSPIELFWTAKNNIKQPLLVQFGHAIWNQNRSGNMTRHHLMFSNLSSSPLKIFTGYYRTIWNQNGSGNMMRQFNLSCSPLTLDPLQTYWHPKREVCLKWTSVLWTPQDAPGSVRSVHPVEL